MNAAKVGERIAALRKERGMTQKQLAEALHVTDKAVSKWERGINFPDLTSVEALAAALDISPAALLGLEHQSPNDVLTAGAEIFTQEYIEWLRVLRRRALESLIFSILLFAVTIWLSYITYFGGLGNETRLPMSLLFSLPSIFCSNAIYTLRNVRKQLRQAAEKYPSARDK